MATVTIDDEVFAKLERVARSRRVTVQQQVEEYLAEAVERRLRAEALRARFDAIAALTPEGVDQTDSVELIREDRDR
jgi:predicted transcriptional regulator